MSRRSRSRTGWPARSRASGSSTPPPDRAPLGLPAAPRPDVTIVVVLTVDADRARTCLEAVAAGVGMRPCEVMLVLNGADDATRALVAHDVTGARVVDAADDLGSPAAWRHAISAARGRWVAFLHED